MATDTAAPAGTGTALDSTAPAGTGETTPAKGTAPASQESAPPSLPHGWMAGLTPEQKANADLIKRLSTFDKGIPDLVGYYASAETAKGSAITIPGEKATAEERAAFRKAIGVPEKPEDYKLDQVQISDPRAKPDEARMNELKALAHKLNVSNGQLNELQKWYFQSLDKDLRVVNTTMDECVATLKTRFGREYDAAMTYKKRALDRFGKPGVVAIFNRSGLGNDPDINEMFVEIGKTMGDHVFAEATRGEVHAAGTVGRRTEAQLATALYPGEKK